ncbi:MAG: endonuclease SmrB [Enterovibrio sp.]
MKNEKPCSSSELALFHDEMRGVKKISHDTIVHPRRTKKIEKQKHKQIAATINNHEFHFSDEYEPQLNEEGPVRYARADVSKYVVKSLRRGDHAPEIVLDLHGLTQQQAKRELAALIVTCIKDNIDCACVMHGIGKHVLKQKTPLWLAQHPDVLAFHQAPREYGGQGALLVLIDLPDNPHVAKR